MNEAPSLSSPRHTGAPGSAPPPPEIPARRVSFEESLQGLPKHFAADGDVFVSHLVAALSAVFPDGEDFFVRSVRRYRDQVTDPDLAKQVAGFMGQESIHGREHRALNARLAELGYPTQRFERMTRRFLTLRERLLPPSSNLAATAALEHVTATLAELLLTDEETRQSLGHDGVRQLFLWHALEESEHKAVAFDVYRTIGGTERMRILTMKLLRRVFVIAIATQIVISMLGDRDTYRVRTLGQTWRSIRRSKVLSRRTWQELKAYERRGFHPSDRDSAALVASWREQLFGPAGALRDKLATRSA